MLTIDGSMGEGGGQILRTSLALSLVTGKAFRVLNIRAAREKPGLRRQHLTAVNAAVQVGSAEVTGNTIGSAELTFASRPAASGKYNFAVGTAGSTSLVLQTVLPALLTADGPSTLVLEGGTHNPMAPPWDFLATTFFPLLEKMGARLTFRLERYGFSLRVAAGSSSTSNPLRSRLLYSWNEARSRGGQPRDSLPNSPSPLPSVNSPSLPTHSTCRRNASSPGRSKTPAAPATLS